MKFALGLFVGNIIITVALIALYDVAVVSKRQPVPQATSVLESESPSQNAAAGVIYDASDNSRIQTIPPSVETPVVESIPSTEGLIKWEDMSPAEQKDYTEKSKPI